MRQFNLSGWLQDKSRKVVTRNNIEVEIIRDSFPLVAIINGVAYNFDNDGKFQSNKTNHKYDLFFADEGDKSQSIEIPFGAKDSEFIRDEYLIPEGCEARIEGNKVIIEKIQKEEPSSIEELLSIITLQEIEYWRTHDKILKQDFNERAKQVLNLARKEILKDLPKWKKVTEHKEFAVHVCVMDEDMYPYLDTEVNEGEHYIELSDLKTLPKEE